MTNRGARIRRGVFDAMAFAAGLALVWATLNWLVEPTSADGTAKIGWLRAHEAAFDTLFVGSSLTARQVVPGVFDPMMAELGFPTRSFNLALPGMLPPEDGYVLEWALSERRAPLLFAVVECQPLRLGIPPQDRGTSRAVYWHDVARMRALWNRAWVPPSRDPGVPESLPRRRDLRDLRRHAYHWLWNLSRLGRGAELLRQALWTRADRRRSQDRDAHQLGPGRDGYRPASEHSLPRKAAEGYLREVAAARGTPRLHYGDRESQAELARKKALVERHGGRLVLVGPPTTGPQLAPLPETGVIFLDFSDPGRYPDLFAPEYRKDTGHLNQRGAEIYSRLLARHLAAALGAPGALAARR